MSSHVPSCGYRDSRLADRSSCSALLFSSSSTQSGLVSRLSAGRQTSSGCRSSPFKYALGHWRTERSVVSTGTAEYLFIKRVGSYRGFRGSPSRAAELKLSERERRAKVLKERTKDKELCWRKTEREWENLEQKRLSFIFYSNKQKTLSKLTPG